MLLYLKISEYMERVQGGIIVLTRPKKVKNKVPILTPEEAVALVPDNVTLYLENRYIGLRRIHLH